MSGPLVRGLARIALNTFDAEALARFYVDALDFAPTGDLLSCGIALRSGGVRVDLREVHRSARPYPSVVAGWSPLFQHFAIMVADVPRAMARLAESKDWSPISTGGPQRLPANTGGVTAFKFRDPDGHPLELLSSARSDAAAADPVPRIDHSAISVADVDRSIAFYATLGLQVRGRSLNTGVEQARLDDLVDPVVDVVALAPTKPTPHVELLAYRGAWPRDGAPCEPDDIAATRLVFWTDDTDRVAALLARAPAVGAGSRALLMRDPDGHLLEFVVEP